MKRASDATHYDAVKPVEKNHRYPTRGGMQKASPNHDKQKQDKGTTEMGSICNRRAPGGTKHHGLGLNKELTASQTSPQKKTMPVLEGLLKRMEKEEKEDEDDEFQAIRKSSLDDKMQDSTKTVKEQEELEAILKLLQSNREAIGPPPLLARCLNSCQNQFRCVKGRGCQWNPITKNDEEYNRASNVYLKEQGKLRKIDLALVIWEISPSWDSETFYQRILEQLPTGTQAFGFVRAETKKQDWGAVYSVHQFTALIKLPKASWAARYRRYWDIFWDVKDQECANQAFYVETEPDSCESHSVTKSRERLHASVTYNRTIWHGFGVPFDLGE